VLLIEDDDRLAQLSKREPGGARETLGAGVLAWRRAVGVDSCSNRPCNTRSRQRGFISSLYVVLVPLLGVLFRHRRDSARGSVRRWQQSAM